MPLDPGHAIPTWPIAYTKYIRFLEDITNKIFLDVLYNYWWGKHGEIWPGEDPNKLADIIKKQYPRDWSKLEEDMKRLFARHVKRIPGYKRFRFSDPESLTILLEEPPEAEEIIKKWKPPSFMYFSPEIPAFEERVQKWWKPTTRERI